MPMRRFTADIGSGIPAEDLDRILAAAAAARPASPARQS